MISLAERPPFKRFFHIKLSSSENYLYPFINLHIYYNVSNDSVDFLPNFIWVAILKEMIGIGGKHPWKLSIIVKTDIILHQIFHK